VAEISEELMIADVERRLTSKYGHLPPDQISAAVQNIRAEPDRDFVPLLIERHARAELTNSRQPAAVVVDTRNLLDAMTLADAGLTYLGNGIPSGF
jgi:hypothetical protein